MENLIVLSVRLYVVITVLDFVLFRPNGRFTFVERIEIALFVAGVMDFFKL